MNGLKLSAAAALLPGTNVFAVEVQPTVTPAAPSVPVSVLRRNVHFGPNQTSLNPLSLPTVESLPGLIQTPPSLFMTNDQCSVSANRA